jgi:hypothetical protein
VILDINKGNAIRSHPPENTTPNLNRNATIKEYVVDIFSLLEIKDTAPLKIICDDAFIV